MKPLRRKPELDALELFRRLDEGSPETTIQSELRLESFLGKIKIDLGRMLANPSTVNAWRAQAGFASLIVALDAAELLMTVDTGDVYYDGSPVKPADFLVVLRDGRRLLVEVKCLNPARPRSRLRVSAAEYEGLIRFANLYGAELYFATLFGAFHQWTLTPASGLTQDDTHHTLGFPEAMATSEMHVLGDVMVGIKPPIRFDLIPDAAQDNRVSGDRAEFSVGSTELWVGGRKMRKEADRRLAWFLLQCGNWSGDRQDVLEAGRVRRISFVASPEESDPENNFALVGSLSEMFARWFDLSTTARDGVVSLQAPAMPHTLGDLIPPKIERSADLPLLLLRVQPNPSFAPDGDLG